MERLGVNRRKRTDRRHQKFNAVKDKLLIILFLVIGVWLVFNPLKRLVVSKMIKYETAQWKVVEQCVPVEGVIIRDETPIISPAEGSFDPIVPEGEKVAVGRILGYIKTQASSTTSDLIKIPVKAPRAGLVSYHPDGLEGVLKPDMLNNLDIEKISDLLAKEQDDISFPPKAEAGKPLAKMIDNLTNPYIYVQYPADVIIAPPAKGERMVIQFSSGEKTNISIKDVKISSDKTFLMAEILNSPDLDLKNRFISLNIITESFEGVTVLKEALVQKEGHTGVFVPWKDVCKWVEVEVEGLVEEQAVVRGLDVGSQYIVNPSLVSEGQRLD